MTTDLLAAELVGLEGGAFLMGSEEGEGYPADGEHPVRHVRVPGFRISATTVTNRQFAAFVADTAHVSAAESAGWSFVFAGLLPDDFGPTRGVASAPWWRQVEHASWAHPEGPGSDIADREDHPVVHVSWDDARAWCAWAGGRLPTEARWEYAARGGISRARYPWGDELNPGGAHLCNVWQGTFPSLNTAEDGFYGTAPVRSFPPNGYGLYEVAGNVWEWCADWSDPEIGRRDDRDDPLGPPSGTQRVMRGGSFMCHESYCHRYRVAARSANTPSSTTSNLGFRWMAEPEEEKRT